MVIKLKRFSTKVFSKPANLQYLEDEQDWNIQIRQFNKDTGWINIYFWKPEEWQKRPDSYDKSGWIRYDERREFVPNGLGKGKLISIDSGKGIITLKVDKVDTDYYDGFCLSVYGTVTDKCLRKLGYKE